MHCNLLTDIRVARETGYDAIEINGWKLYRYLDTGLSIDGVKRRLDGFPAVGIGFIQDIERQEPNEYQALLQECDKMCSLARQLGIPLVHLLTGPIGPGVGVVGGYQGLMGRPWPEIRKLTAKNLKALSAIGKQHNVGFYLEALAFASLHSLDQMIELLDAAECDNVYLLIDFWHTWTTGTTPEKLAKLDPKRIAAVHFCDALAVPKDKPITHDLRDVWTGGGHIPLQEWVDAILSTDFDGWWGCELWSKKHWERDPWETARLLKDTLKYMLVAAK
jgi:sugar phosphate isomerase/epimerase